MDFCKECGRERTKNALYCKHCGARGRTRNELPTRRQGISVR
nr:zinc-ribbon domain-containing protein [Bacillus licheniformis]